MLTTVSQIRKLIREEIGRNFQTKQSFDAYPWVADEMKVEIYPDVGNDSWNASVEVEPGKFVKATKATQEEATHWARAEWEKARRKKFAGNPRHD